MYEGEFGPSSKDHYIIFILINSILIMISIKITYLLLVRERAGHKQQGV